MAEIQRRKTIFLVDDDVTNLMIGKNTLSESYNVFTLNSGARLLKILEKNIPDLILLDIEMPDMNGYETIKILKSKPETMNVPVVFLTAKSDADSELEGFSLGAIDYIIKPFSPILLYKRVESHMLIQAQKKTLSKYSSDLTEIAQAKTATVQEIQNAILRTMAEVVDFRDDIEGGHIEKTQNCFRLLVGALEKQGIYQNEISTWDFELVMESAALYDIGKIKLHDEVLKKPGKLTANEFDDIKHHTDFGEKLIEKIKSRTSGQEFLDYAAILAGAHHERWDGAGYPKGLKGEEIPLLGRIMAIADVYDALVSERPYKKAFGHREAVDIIADGRGRHFDPAIVDAFISVSDEFDKIYLRQNNLNINDLNLA